MSAPAAAASSRYMLSLLSRQSVTVITGSTHTAREKSQDFLTVAIGQKAAEFGSSQYLLDFLKYRTREGNNIRSPCLEDCSSGAPSRLSAAPTTEPASMTNQVRRSAL
jgi:hypothetical protein